MTPPSAAERAVVVGSGPNGLAAAIVLAQAGYRVTVLEAHGTPGGGMRSAELTLPGFTHDVCSAVHPLAVASPFFASLPLEQHGLEWVHPEVPLAHPLDGGDAVLLHRSVEETAAGLGQDGDAYRSLLGPLVRDWERLAPAALGPVTRVPRAPFLLARFGLSAMRSATGLARSWFRGERARALLAGIAAHANVPLDGPLSAAPGLMLAVAAHAAGWPVARGGSGAIADALVAHLSSLGGEIEVNRRVESLHDLPRASVVIFDTSPREVARILGERLPRSGARRLERHRHGSGVFKLDLALRGPIPWVAPGAAVAGTLHLGGTMEEMAASEAAVARGEHPERPYVLVAQQSRFDRSRVPAGREALWAYCHVPAGSTVDMTERIEAQIERFAPGFRDLVLARHSMHTRDLEAYNANYVGGDIGGGSVAGWRALFRPGLRLRPYATPARGYYLASAATPPGPGVHGMCGYFAAQAALRQHQPGRAGS